jgi:predicted DNA-binding transcriptional regulator YafY
MTSPLQPVPLICSAIEQTRMLRLIYHNKERVIEPHDHGILNGSLHLFGYQVAGSSSRALLNWRLMKTDEIVDLELLDRTFPGGRPTASGSHIKWEKLFIRVKPASERTRTGAT